MRYLRQRKADTYSCGPIALINAMKWAGNRTTEKHLNRYRKLCRASKMFGTSIPDLMEAIRKRKSLCVTDFISFSAHKLLREIDKHVSSGGSAILVMPEKGYGCLHASFCAGKEKNKYLIVNINPSKTVIKLTKKELLEKLKPTKSIDKISLYSRVFLLEKQRRRNDKQKED